MTDDSDEPRERDQAYPRRRRLRWLAAGLLTLVSATVPLAIETFSCWGSPCRAHVEGLWSLLAGLLAAVGVLLVVHALANPRRWYGTRLGVLLVVVVLAWPLAAWGYAVWNEAGEAEQPVRGWLTSVSHDRVCWLDGTDERCAQAYLSGFDQWQPGHGFTGRIRRDARTEPWRLDVHERAGADELPPRPQWMADPQVVNRQDGGAQPPSDANQQAQRAQLSGGVRLPTAEDRIPGLVGGVVDVPADGGQVWLTCPPAEPPLTLWRLGEDGAAPVGDVERGEVRDGWTLLWTGDVEAGVVGCAPLRARAAPGPRAGG